MCVSVSPDSGKVSVHPILRRLSNVKRVRECYWFLCQWGSDRLKVGWRNTKKERVPRCESDISSYVERGLECLFVQLSSIPRLVVTSFGVLYYLNSSMNYGSAVSESLLQQPRLSFPLRLFGTVCWDHRLSLLMQQFVRDRESPIRRTQYEWRFESLV